MQIDLQRAQLLDAVSSSLNAAIGSAQALNEETATARALVALLERTAAELQAFKSAQTSIYTDAIYPEAAMALAVIETLSPGHAVGFLFRRDGAGRCFVRMWNATPLA